MEKIEKILVIGAGVMGHQFAVHFAYNNYFVNLVDISKKQIEKAKNMIEKELDTRIIKGKISEVEKGEILQKISYYYELTPECAKCEFVIEAINEDIELKQNIFKKLDALTPENAILGSNTSAIRPSLISQGLKHPDRVIAINFGNPIWEAGFVEIMRSNKTSDEIYETTIELCKSLGFLPIRVKKEQTGFALNRLWRVIKKECLRLVAENIIEVDEFDKGFQKVFQSPFGPYQLMDQVGLKTIRDVELIYYNESQDPSDKPPKFLLDMVENGENGVWSGKGFYEYHKG